MGIGDNIPMRHRVRTVETHLTDSPGVLGAGEAGCGTPVETLTHFQSKVMYFLE